MFAVFYGVTKLSLLRKQKSIERSAIAAFMDVPTQYVVLLRGINVGGNRLINMKDLKSSLEDAGFIEVKTYINSGNVLLKSNLLPEEVSRLVQGNIQAGFGYEVDVLTLTGEDLQNIAGAIPENWTNDATMRCDCLFLWHDVDTPEVLKSFEIKEGIDRVMYLKGAVVWSLDRENAAKSGLRSLIGTDLYKKVTVRNCNTVRKLATLIND